MKAVHGVEIYLSKKNNNNFLKIPLTWKDCMPIFQLCLATLSEGDSNERY
jgi:hypothetical protein